MQQGYMQGGYSYPYPMMAGGMNPYSGYSMGMYSPMPGYGAMPGYGVMGQQYPQQTGDKSQQQQGSNASKDQQKPNEGQKSGSSSTSKSKFCSMVSGCINVTVLKAVYA